MQARSVSLAILMAVCIGLALPCAAPAQKDAKIVKIHLHGDAVVNEPIVLLSAVADIEGGEAWMRQKIGGLDVAEVSRVGKTVVISRDQVAMRIQLAGFDVRSFQVNGPAQSMVKLKTVELTPEQVVVAAQQAVLHRFKAAAKDVEFRLMEPVRLPVISIGPEDVVRLAVDSQNEAKLEIGKARVDVVILVNDQRRAVISVVLDVALYKDAAIATRHIDVGEALSADCLRTERRLVRAGDTWVPYGEQLLGKRVLRAIQAGQLVNTVNLVMPVDEDEVVIHTRDTIKLVAIVGNMRISTAGEAMQDGKLGQLIRVRNIDSGKSIAGRVVDRTSVEVEY